MDAAGSEKEGGTATGAVGRAGEQYKGVDTIAEFAGKLEEGEWSLWAHRRRRRWLCLVQVWVWEGVHEVVLPCDHDERIIVPAAQVNLYSGRRYHKRPSISGIMTADDNIECNNATGRSAHRLGLAVALESTIWNFGLPS